MKNNYGYYIFIDTYKIEINNIHENIKTNKLSIFYIKYYIQFLLYIIEFIKNLYILNSNRFIK